MCSPSKSDRPTSGGPVVLRGRGTNPGAATAQAAAEADVYKRQAHVFAWGGGRYGQIGHGRKEAMQFRPLRVETHVSMISATAYDVVTG